MEGLDSSCALLRELDKVFWRVDPGWVLPLLSAVSAFFFDAVPTPAENNREIDRVATPIITEANEEV